MMKRRQQCERLADEEGEEMVKGRVGPQFEFRSRAKVKAAKSRFG